MASEACAKHIITDMYAQAVQGMPPADAVRWADRRPEQTYAR